MDRIYYYSYNDSSKSNMVDMNEIKLLTWSQYNIIAITIVRKRYILTLLWKTHGITQNPGSDLANKGHLR